MFIRLCAYIVPLAGIEPAKTISYEAQRKSLINRNRHEVLIGPNRKLRRGMHSK